MNPKLNYDDLDDLVCRRCGLRDKETHATPDACIAALRDLLAIQDIKQKPEQQGGAKRDGFKQIVVLDGVPMRLDAAAKKLQMTPCSLYERIKERTKLKTIPECVDLRGIGADVARSRGYRRVTAASAVDAGI